MNLYIKSNATDANGGGALYLSVIQGPPAVIVSKLIGGTDQTQLWLPLQAPEGGVVLLNVATNKIVQCTADEQHGNLTMVNQTFPTPRNSRWNYKASSQAWQLLSEDGWDLNLNILGNNWTSGCEVAAWGWGHGDPNETWVVTPNP